MIPPQPTIEHVNALLTRFNADDRYFGADRAIQLVIDQWPLNEVFDHVLIKAVLINRLYSTNIYNIYGAANHIVNLHIDDQLQRGDSSLVDKIARMEVSNGERINLAFAAKYCAWHQPDKFQIFDNLVADLLCKYRRQYQFATFGRSDLRDYPTFIHVIEQFQNFFGLKTFSRKHIDKFLWMEAKIIKGLIPSG